MEGKNCFRTKWTQEPIYSGGGVATLLLPTATAAEREVCLAMACGNALHVVAASTGEVRTTFTLPTDDVILSIDAVTVDTADRTVCAEKEEYRSAPPRSAVVRHAEEEWIPPTKKTKTERKKEEQLREEDILLAPAPSGSYIAVGTRALQIYVFRVDVVQIEDVSDPTPEREEASAVSVPLESDALPEVASLEFHCTVVQQWTAAQQAISCLCFSRLGHSLVSGSTDGSLKVWNIFHHHLTHNLHCPSSTLIHSLYLSDEEDFLVSGSFEGFVSVFDFASKQIVASGRPHVQAVEAVTVVRDGDDVTLYSIARDRKMAVSLLNVQKQMLEERRAIVVKEPLSAAYWEGARLLHTGSLDGVVNTYAIAKDGGLKKQCSLPKPAASNAEDRTEESSVRCIKPKFDIKGVERVDPSRPSPLFVADTGFNVHILAANAHINEYEVLQTLIGFLDQVLEIKILPEAIGFERLVINNSKDVRLFDGSGCLSSRCLQGHSDIVMSAAVSNDGRVIATGGKDMEIRFWSTATWKTIGIGEKGHSAEITAIRFNAKQAEDYLLLFSIAADENLRLWDAGKHVWSRLTSTEASRFSPRAGVNSAHAGPVYTIEVAPNDQYVASGGKDKVINLWTVSGKKIFKEGVLKGHRRGITALSFSAVDRVLASASNDGTVRLWSLTSLTCIKTLQADKTAVLQVSLFNAGSQLVTTNAEGVLRVWAMAAGEVVWTGEVHHEKVWALAVQERGNDTVFLTGAADGVMVATADCTAEEVTRIREELADTIVKEQELANSIRKGDFQSAFHLALRLDHPRHLRQVVEKWMAQNPKECEDVLQTVIVPELQESLMLRLLQFIREWLTNSRHCAVASLLLRSFLSSKHFQDIAKIGAMRHLVEPLLSYSRKHSQRLHELLQKTYYVDYVTRAVSHQALTSQPPYATLKP